MKVHRQAAAGMALLFLMVQSVLAQPGPADCKTSQGITICARLDNRTETLVEDTHYSFEPGPAGTPPGIELLRGSDAQGTYEWRVWAQADGIPGDIHHIRALTAYDYAVTIRHWSESVPAGAANVGEISLTPSGDNYSNIRAGSAISGAVASMTVQPDSTGAGGIIEDTTIGSVSGTMSVGLARNLTINTLSGTFTAARVEPSLTFGTVSGTVTISTLDGGTQGGGLTVLGDVTSTGLITVGNKLGLASVQMGDSISDSFAGTLVLEDGVGPGQFVSIGGLMSSTSVVNLNGAGVQGGSEFTAFGVFGGSGQIINGGLVSGELTAIYLGGSPESKAPFTGSATFAGVGGGHSSITSTGDFPGILAITGSIGSDSVIDIFGDLTSSGWILVNGDIAGSIRVFGDCDGIIHANDDEIGIGNLTGNVTLGRTGTEITGTFNGEICGSNLHANYPLPSNIDIAAFGTGFICGQADSCLGSPPNAVQVAMGTEEPIKKNRYISFRPDTNPGQMTALRVRLKNLPFSNPNYYNSIGEYRWVGPKRTDQDLAGFPLQCNPYYRDWSGEGTIHVCGLEVLHGSTYEVQAFHSNCDSSQGFENNYSAMLPLQTEMKWGDVVAPYGGISQPNFNDINEAIDGFSSDVFGAPLKVRTDIAPGIPNQNANFIDIADVVSAFRTDPYPYAAPENDVCVPPPHQ